MPNELCSSSLCFLFYLSTLGNVSGLTDELHMRNSVNHDHYSAPCTGLVSQKDLTYEYILVATGSEAHIKGNKAR